MQLSAPNLAVVRTRPQRTGLYLSIFQPRIVFQAQINSVSATKGTIIIPFDNVTLGSVADVEAGMTMLVGTSVGARDVGKIRIKSVLSASSFQVSESADVAFADDLYISVQRYFELC